MTNNKMERLNLLFERMITNKASDAECFELRVLYQEFFYDGREYNHSISSTHPELKVVG